MKKEHVYLGADHAGFELKENIKRYLSDKVQLSDLGSHKYEKHDDYPKYAQKVAKSVSKDKSAKGILVCGSAQGMCIAANKVKHVRAVTPNTQSEAKLTRQHNDSNVLCLSGWNLSTKEAFKIIDVWLKTEFSKDPRHTRRLKEIAKIER